MLEEVRKHIKELLDAQIIRKSQSPWASNIVLVRKKDKSLRLCVDYRQLNRRTIKDSYALPRIDELLDGLSGSKYFSVLDMKSGYHQIEVEEEHKARTAFTVGSLGFYEYNRLPFGLTNAPATYQRLMEEVFAELNHSICHIYLDDVIVFSDSYEEHLSRLEKVFIKLREAGLKLSPKKCRFFEPEVKYVGHIVSSTGIRADPEKLDKISTWTPPTNIDQLRSFLGFTGYYRKFVKDYAKLAKPLNELLVGIGSKKQRSKKPPEAPKWHWDQEQQQAFEVLKENLISPPILSYPDYAQPFSLYTDASTSGLGAVLCQKQNGKEHVIAYASRGLSKSEQHYTAHKLEFLALKWSITQKFHDYLYGNNFKVITDNNPLTYILTSAKLDATGHRWLAALATYNFSIEYLSGKKNVIADTLSRFPEESQNVIESGCCSVSGCYSGQAGVVSSDVVQAVCCRGCSPYIDSICFSSREVEEDDEEEDCDIVADSRLWRSRQLNDPLIGSFSRAITNQDKTLVEDQSDSVGKTLLKEFGHLLVRRGVLYRQVKNKENKGHLQLVIPEAFREEAWIGAHNDVGHFGHERSLDLLRSRVYWPKMSADLQEWIDQCERCIKRKASTNTKVPLVSIKTTYPLEIVTMDFLTLESSKGGFQHILVMTDHFTRFAVAVPTRNMSAKTTATAFFEQFVVKYGFPDRIHSDQGGNFESKILKELCQVANINKSRTTSYHPMGNGQCERMNRTLLNMLGTLDPAKKTDWKTHLGPLVHAYNSTKHETTGYSPHYLMFGRQPKLALDISLGLSSNPDVAGKDYDKYVQDMKVKLDNAYQLAGTSAEKAQQHQKRNFDRKARGGSVKVGDRVLVKVVAYSGKHKIADKWEQEAYQVIHQPNPDIPVFVVQREDGEGPRRTLHRNLLLPIGSTLMKEKEESMPSKSVSPKPQTKAQPEAKESISEKSDGTGSESEDEESYQMVTRTVNQEEVEEETEVEESEEESEEQEEEQSSQSEEEAQAPEPPPQPTQPAPRRSGRKTRPPAWIRGDEFIASQQVKPVTPDWMQRAEFLSSMVDCGSLRKNDMVVSTLLGIISGK